jgi:hypothetical protein
MRRWGWLLIGLVLAGCGPHGKPGAAGASQILGLPYTQARRLLLGQGYRAAHFGLSDTPRRRSEMCDDIAGARCRTYWETWDCPGAGACEFDFIRISDHQVLRVITDGEFPPSVGDARWATEAELKVRNITNR